MLQRLRERFLTLRGGFDARGRTFGRTDWIATASVVIGVVLLPIGFLAIPAAALGANLIVVGLLILTRHFPGST